uniref:Nuclear cap-binding protein subunit 2 n=2 Tax=Oreochromis TaxID=8139 RepID=A0A669BB24_ORENI
MSLTVHQQLDTFSSTALKLSLCSRGEKYDGKKLNVNTSHIRKLYVHKLFSKSGDVTRIIIGLDETKKTACGFCFVEYYTCADAEHALRFINGTRLDNSIIRTDWDASRMKAVRAQLPGII